LTYTTTGNIDIWNGTSYGYSNIQPHAVSSIGDAVYAYDANGNMVWHGEQLYAWDGENRLTSVTESGIITGEFVYDGDGNRLKKTEGGEVIIYVNQYYEKNVTANSTTSYYYLGGKLIAQSQNGTLSYIHQDHLTSTSLMTNTDGVQIDASGAPTEISMKYMPFGETLSGNVSTDKLFTGQRLDSTGLYYYGARYYDPVLGRFISADISIPDSLNP